MNCATPMCVCALKKYNNNWLTQVKPFMIFIYLFIQKITIALIKVIIMETFEIKWQTFLARNECISKIGIISTYDII